MDRRGRHESHRRTARGGGARRCGDGRIRAAARPHAETTCSPPIADAPVAADRRQGDSAQEPEPDLLPDQRRRPRGRARRGRHASARRLRLVLPVLPRSRALPGARRHAARDAPAGGRREGRSRVRRTPDAVALGQPAPEHRLAGQPDRHAVPAGGRLRRSGTALRATSRRFRSARSASIPTRSPHLDRRRRHERRRVLGIAEHRLHAAAAGAVPGRGQRLRDLGARRGADAGRRHLRLVDVVPAPHGAGSRRHRLPRQLRRDGRGGGARARAAGARCWCTRHVIRPYSHSLSDDERLYKTPEEREAEATRDPLAQDARAAHRSEGLATESRPERRSRPTVDREVQEATDAALAAAKPDARHRRALGVLAGRGSDRSTTFAAEPHTEGKPDTMVAAINRTLHDEMARNPRIVVFGEDVADSSDESTLATVPGKGGVFKVTHGLQKALRQHARVQLAARRGEHRRPRRRHGAARDQAGGRNPVLRLHLAGDDADPRRDGDDALPLGQQLLVPDGDPRADRRLPARRRAVSQPVGREHLRALPGHPHRVPVERASTRRGCCAPRSGATTR